MHDIEPFWNWRHKYTSEEDERSPFFGEEHSEIYFTNAVYNHLIHPQWDSFGSSTLYMKVLFADYEDGFAILELIGEWNDLLHNDVMTLKRNIIEHLMANRIQRFILIGENVLNFHASDDEYYAEWFDEVNEADGWIALLNFRPHVLEDMQAANIDQYFLLGGKLDALRWRTLGPEELYEVVGAVVMKRLGP
ncbi:MAG: hypothetical protein IPF41_09830 [Flavobacteriales bacterium]|nr:hypothetical protein [Flavobacteriales bacterium]